MYTLDETDDTPPPGLILALLEALYLSDYRAAGRASAYERILKQRDAVIAMLPPEAQRQIEAAYAASEGVWTRSPACLEAGGVPLPSRLLALAGTIREQIKEAGLALDDFEPPWVRGGAGDEGQYMLGLVDFDDLNEEGDE